MYEPIPDDLAGTLDAALSPLGLYVKGGAQTIHPETGQLAYVLDIQLGMKAFQPKVQDPESTEMDDQFQAMVKNTQEEAFFDIRNELLADYQEPDGPT